MLRKLIDSLKGFDEKLCENISDDVRKKREKGMNNAESWCSKQKSEQINTLTENDAVLAYRYYLDFSGVMVFKDSSPQDIERIRQEANRVMPINIVESVEELIKGDEIVVDAIENKKRLDKIKLF